MKATLKGRYDTAKKASGNGIFALNAGEVKLRASITDHTIINPSRLEGLSLTLEKPGAFEVDYDVPKKDFRFQFMNTIKVAQKPLNMTYTHGWGNKRNLSGTLVLDQDNKVSADYMLDSKNCKLKYTYVHKGLTTLQPSYDVAKNSWDIEVSQKLYDKDPHSLKFSYQTSNNTLGLEWSLKSKQNSSLKIGASLELAEELKLPKVSAETTFDFEM